MLFRQLFDNVSCTYTYLLAGGPGGEALLIDPVADKVERYLRLLEELDLRLVKAIDTHVHADHISGLAVLRDRTRCITVMGRHSKVDVVSMRVDDNDRIEIDGVALNVLYTPGHTDDSYCFRMNDRVFTGDTLLIRGTGRTDFQNGDARRAYHSLFDTLLRLPDELLVYPGHDYKGDTVSTIGEERAHNPRLKVGNADEYAAMMADLKLDNPKMMDVAVPANLAVGLRQAAPELAAFTVTAEAARREFVGSQAVWIDLREAGERQRDGLIPGSVHVPYARLAEALAAGSPFRALAARTTAPMVFYCAFGERSAMALQAAHEAGLGNVFHLAGGLDAWLKAGGDCAREPG
jgi:glyoxylase-like metal-dependent hydrolase (beta-lactamase superfamily II)/rhodanese-related sulfurtransferase